MQISEYQAGSSWYTQSLFNSAPNVRKAEDASDPFAIEKIERIDDNGDSSESLVSSTGDSQAEDFAYQLYLQEIKQRENVPSVENSSGESQGDLMEAADSQPSPMDEVSAPKSKKEESDDKKKTTTEIVVNPDGSRQLVITTRVGSKEIVTKLELSPEQQDDSFAQFQQQDNLAGAEAAESANMELPHINPSLLMTALSAYEASFQYSL